MLNHTFFIVVREKDIFNPCHKNLGRDQWGYEYADGVEIFTYEEAKRMRQEYAAAMPSHLVLIRSVRIKKETS